MWEIKSSLWFTSIKENHDSDYRNNVIKPWDTFSEDAKNACLEWYKNNIHATFLKGKWNVITLDKEVIDQWVELSVSIDWEGTKWQIYEAMFDREYGYFSAWFTDEERFMAFCIDLRERRLHDLIAMNTDDLLNGELCYNTTLYIHFEKLEGKKWMILKDTFTQAMKNIQEREKVSIVAWETAIMGNTPKERKLIDVMNTIKWNVESEIDSRLKDFKFNIKSIFTWNPLSNIAKMIAYSFVKKYSEEVKIDLWLTFAELDNKKSHIMDWTYFSLVWTAQWMKLNWSPKLEKIQQWDILLMIEEKWEIKGPRANWITAIRNWMKKIAWDDWASVSFESFIKELNSDREKEWIEWLSPLSFSEWMYDKCRWKKLGDIATWKTTIYNQFVADDLLWWILWKPHVKISWLSHVTWNPLKKISKLTSWKNTLSLEIDLDEVELPPIMELLQVVWWVDDLEAVWQWNMWVPYVLSCPETSVDEIKKIAWEKGFVVKNIWSITAKKDQDIIVKNIGKWKSHLWYSWSTDTTIQIQ